MAPATEEKYKHTASKQHPQLCQTNTREYQSKYKQFCKHVRTMSVHTACVPLATQHLRIEQVGNHSLAGCLPLINIESKLFPGHRAIKNSSFLTTSRCNTTRSFLALAHTCCPTRIFHYVNINFEPRAPPAGGSRGRNNFWCPRPQLLRVIKFSPVCAGGCIIKWPLICVSIPGEKSIRMRRKCSCSPKNNIRLWKFLYTHKNIATTCE